MSEATSSIVDSHPPRGKLVVLVGCVLAGIVFLSAAVLLCMHWLHQSSPDAMVIIMGHEGMDGVTVQVTPIDPGVTAPPIAELSKNDNYRARIHIIPGDYALQIAYHGQPLLRRNFTATKESPFFAELSVPTTKPKTRIP
jgi:hypothetical protein